MILSDQPTCFPDDILVRVSSKSDGTVLDRAVGVHNPAIVTNRTRFCDAIGISYGNVVYQRIIYGESQTYDRIVDVDDGDTCRYVDEVHADALMTETPGVGLMLPVADCVATVLYDPRTKRLALAHLGRHSTVANLMTKVISHFISKKSNPADIIVWMAPSIKRDNYTLEYFDQADDPDWQEHVDITTTSCRIDMQGYNRMQAIAAGVLPEHINESPVDTAVHDEYFSHSHGDVTGRFAVVAMIR